jgi:replicative DNA helicase
MQQTPETTLIGDVIVDPNILMNVRRFVPTGSVFADTDAGRVYDLILTLYDERGIFDLAILSERVVQSGLPPSDLGGYMALAHPNLSEYHAKVVAEGHVKRSTLNALNKVRDELSLGTADVFDSVNTAMNLLSSLKQAFQQEMTVHISHVVQEASSELDDIFSGKTAMGLPFGFSMLDDETGGMDKGDLVVVAAPEKSGKSTLMIQVVFFNAERGTPCLIFSSEMMRKQLLYRKALMDTRIRWIDVKRGRMDSSEKEALMRRMRELAALPVYIRHGVFSVMDIQADAERYIRDKGVQLIAVDYIQRIVPKATKADNREREVAAISAGLKNIALEYGIPVLALSQVNDDLRARESRAIEQDMDKMITLDKHPEKVSKTEIPVPLRIRQRMGLSGSMGDVNLYYDILHGIWRNLPNEDANTAEKVAARFLKGGLQ